MEGMKMQEYGVRAKLTIEVGRLWWKQIRALLDNLARNDSSFSYIEGVGFLEKEFILRGSPELIKDVMKMLEPYV